MTPRDTSSRSYHHGAERRRKDGLVTAVQALFGGSVIYRVFAHFMKEPEFEAQVLRIIPKDKLPLIAAGTAAAGAIGLFGQRSKSAAAETSLARALDEMTAEAAALRTENARLRSATVRPTTTVRQATASRLDAAHRDRDRTPA